MPIITGPILDSSGKPANGLIRVAATRAFDTGAGHVTRAVGVGTVRDGEPYSGDAPWSLPVTPEGVWLMVEQDLDGEAVQRFTVTVPTGETLSYSQLLFHRGESHGGTEPYWWDLTGGAEFPPGAVDGDFGYDTVTGDVWRFEA